MVTEGKEQAAVDEEAIIQAIQRVEHPEINCTLVELGMVKDIQVSGNQVSLKLVLPFLGIPAVIRDHLIRSLQQAVADFGAKLKVQVAEMTPLFNLRLSCLRRLLG